MVGSHVEEKRGQSNVAALLLEADRFSLSQVHQYGTSISFASAALT
jgi:hypothetical protein